MDDDEPYTVEGKPAPRFQVYIWNGKETLGRVAEYETEEELMKHKQRLDRVEVLVFRRKTGREVVPVMKYIEKLKDAKG